MPIGRLSCRTVVTVVSNVHPKAVASFTQRPLERDELVPCLRLHLLCSTIDDIHIY